MLQLDGQVAREREAQLTQHSNPQATSQSNGEAVAYADQGSDPFEESSDEEGGTHFSLGLQATMKKPNLRLSRAMN
jgi:hypothetical protein